LARRNAQQIKGLCLPASRAERIKFLFNNAVQALASTASPAAGPDGGRLKLNFRLIIGSRHRRADLPPPGGKSNSFRGAGSAVWVRLLSGFPANI
jgi:hypothetical protein